MKCPYCETEMERGRLFIALNNPLSVHWIAKRWYAETDFEGELKRKAAAKPTGMATDDYYLAFKCSKCRRIFGEFII